MTLSRSELKSRARQSLSGNYQVMCLSVLMLGLISALLNMIFYFQLNSRLMSALTFLIITLLMSVLYTGFFSLCLQVCRGKHPSFADLFAVFRHHPDKVILIALIIGAIDTAASAPFIALLIISGRNASWVSFVQNHPGASMLIDILVIIIWIIWLIIVNSPFLCTFFLYIDRPEGKVTEFIKESCRLMKGQCGKFIRLMLSFAGMILLAVLSLGIGLLWVFPYIGATCAQFYLNLNREY